MRTYSKRKDLEESATEYGVSPATVSNWVRAYREECLTNDKQKSKLELMEENRKLRQQKIGYLTPFEKRFGLG